MPRVHTFPDDVRLSLELADISFADAAGGATPFLAEQLKDRTSYLELGHKGVHAESRMDSPSLDFGPSQTLGGFKCWSKLCLGICYCRLGLCGVLKEIFQFWIPNPT
jgi:hypothetical protein